MDNSWYFSLKLQFKCIHFMLSYHCPWVLCSILQNRFPKILLPDDPIFLPFMINMNCLTKSIGSKFLYSTHGFTLLAAVIEHATGEKFEKVNITGLVNKHELNRVFQLTLVKGWILLGLVNKHAFKKVNITELVKKHELKKVNFTELVNKHESKIVTLQCKLTNKNLF